MMSLTGARKCTKARLVVCIDFVSVVICATASEVFFCLKVVQIIANTVLDQPQPKKA